MKKKDKLDILVTGAGGLQGYHLVRDLLEQPQTGMVVGVDDFSRPFLENPMKWAKTLDDRFELQKRRYQSLSVSEISDFDVIIHLAASVSVPESMESDEMQRAYWENNATGTLDFVIKMMQTKDWPVLVYASTSETFGNPLTYPMTEEHLQNPQSIYAVSKLSAEKIILAHAAWNSFPGVVVRTFNTYGPNQNSGFSDAAVVALFLKKALTGETLYVHGDGTQTRDFQYAGDAVRAYRMLALARCSEDMEYKYTGMQFNTGTGKMTPIRHLADMVISLTDSMSDVKYSAARSGDIVALQADSTKIRNELGWKAEIPLEEGLRRTAEWFRRVDPTLSNVNKKNKKYDKECDKSDEDYSQLQISG
ncbi:MAG: GDP-mannose 4,6-dehydratase [Candidatus Woesearchaeota archaeon]